jgi:hypothetical protein
MASQSAVREVSETMTVSHRNFLVAFLATSLAGCGILPFDSAQGKLAQDDTPRIGAPGAVIWLLTWTARKR